MDKRNNYNGCTKPNESIHENGPPHASKMSTLFFGGTWEDEISNASQ